MPKPALQTRQIGLQPHYSRHPLAPMEVVYEVEKPPGVWARFRALGPRKQAALAIFLASTIYLTYAVCLAAADIAANGAEPWFFPVMGILGSLYLGAYALRRR